ncbi:hypothetical protein, partial [Candidatus Aquicultor secundus]
AVLFLVGLFALMRAVSSFGPKKSTEEFIPRSLSQVSQFDITAEDLIDHDTQMDPQKKKEILIQ